MPKLTSEADGRKLAIKMLAEIEVYETAPGDVHSLWPWAIEAMYRSEGTQQDNVLLRYLDTIQRQGSPEVLAAFCATLTDFLGSHLIAGSTTDPLYYKTLTERDITGSPGPWPRMDDGEFEAKTNVIPFASRGAH